MKSKTILGSLKKVELREFWEDEARDFTPWLAQPENLALLGESIGMELELVGREQRVGGFKLDILAKDTLSGRYVVIENQLEKTNHGHLGQLLTYASGYEAMAVVWVANSVCEEHRRALDWLNEMTIEDIGFFGLEIELWKIGESSPAPKFNIVSQPNNWARHMKPSQGGKTELTETKMLQHEFWEKMVTYFTSKKTFLSMRKAQPQHWYDLGVGRSGFMISLTVNSKTKQIGCSLYISASEAKIAYAQLLEQKIQIEKELGSKLDWQELPTRNACRIAEFHKGDYEDPENWDKLFAWLVSRAEAFHKTFSNRVKELELEEDAA